MGFSVGNSGVLNSPYFDIKTSRVVLHLPGPHLLFVPLRLFYSDTGNSYITGSKNYGRDTTVLVRMLYRGNDRQYYNSRQ